MSPEEHKLTGVRQALAALKRSLLAHLVGRGSALVVAALVLAVFATLGVDYLLHLDRIQRMLIAALALGTLGFVLWRHVLRPLKVPMTSEELALVFEAHDPRLMDRVISALQFVDRPTSRIGGSPDLINEVIRQAEQMVAQLQPTSALEARGTWRRAGLAALAVAVLAGFSAWQAPIMKLWFQRNVLFANVDWPKQTYLTVVGGPNFKAVRGESLQITVTADPDHVVPRDVSFHLEFEDLPTMTETVSPASPGGNTFVKTFENVVAGAKFYVTGNDDRTGACRIVVVDPPELVDVHFWLNFPPYTNRPPSEAAAEHGVLALPPGSKLALTGRSNKELASARLLLDGKPAGSVRVREVKDEKDSAPGRPLGLEATLLLPEIIKNPSLSLVVELTDTEQITNKRGAAFVLRIEPDRAPAVALTRLAVRGDISTRALVPLMIDARDDFGVAAMEIAAEFVSPASTTQPTTGPAGAPASQPTSQPARKFAVKLEQAGQPVLAVRHEVDLEPLRLAVGQVVRMEAVCTDTLPDSFGGPNVTRSAVQTLRVVTDEELLEELVRRQKEVHQEFERWVNLEAEIRDRVRLVHERLAQTNAAIDADIRRHLETASADQRRVAGQCAVVLQQLHAVVDEMVYNRIGLGADKAKLADKVVAPLEDLSGKPMADIAAALERNAKGAQAATVRDFAEQAAQVLDDLHTRMAAILAEMRQIESRQDLANRLKVLLQWTTEIDQQIQEELRTQTGSIFQTLTQPGPATRPAAPSEKGVNK